MDKDKKGDYALKKGLQKKKDYIIVNDLVWDFFCLNYNGGPGIILNNNDNVYASYQGTNKIEYQSSSAIKDLFVAEPYAKKSSSEEIEFMNKHSNDTIVEFAA